MSLRLKEADREHLVAGAAALGVDLDPLATVNLCRFADVLDLWAPRVNLVSCRSSRELVERHFLDSLALASALPAGVIVDLGTGAGFPGLPLAILRVDQPFVLVEARRRRATFVREVRRTLGLANVEILEQRAENPPPRYAGSAAAVLSRATWSDESLLDVAMKWLGPDGTVLWMRSEPLTALVPPFVREQLLRYQIGTDRGRCIEVLRAGRQTFHVKQ